MMTCLTCDLLMDETNSPFLSSTDRVFFANWTSHSVILGGPTPLKIWFWIMVEFMV